MWFNLNMKICFYKYNNIVFLEQGTKKCLSFLRLKKLRLTLLRIIKKNYLISLTQEALFTVDTTERLILHIFKTELFHRFQLKDYGSNRR